MQKIPLQALPEYDKLSVRRKAAVRLELTFEEKKARVRDFRPIDDVFFEALAVMPGVCEEILRTILEDPALTVLEVVPQSSERNIYGRSVRLDALCTLGSGKKVNIEIQRADNDDHFRRARFNASAITVKDSNPGERFEEVLDLYIVYITEHDFMKEGKTTYHIDKIARETGTVIHDGLEEIFVNTEVSDGTDIAELMQCFQQKTVNHPKFPAMSEAVWNLKETEGGTESMCDIMQKYMEKDIAKAKAEGLAEGMEKGMEKGIFTMAENLRGYGLTEAQITELVRKSREGTGADAKRAN